MCGRSQSKRYAFNAQRYAFLLGDEEEEEEKVLPLVVECAQEAHLPQLNDVVVHSGVENRETCETILSLSLAPSLSLMGRQLGV